MMSEKQVESWSRRGHIDSFANRVGAEGLFEEECPPCKLIDVGNAKRYVKHPIWVGVVVVSREVAL